MNVPPKVLDERQIRGLISLNESRIRGLRGRIRGLIQQIEDLKKQLNSK